MGGFTLVIRFWYLLVELVSGRGTIMAAPAAGVANSVELDNPHLDPAEKFSYVKLVSADQHQFFLDRRIAYECDTFRKMIEQDAFQEGQTQEIKLPTITGKLLEKVIEYLYYKYKYTDSRVPIPEFQIENDDVLDLLLVANYLNLY